MAKIYSVKTYTAKSPAKINIGLRVLSKRRNGYHNIETIFYPVKIYDVIKVKISNSEKNNAVSVKTGSKKLDNKKNITYKAANLFLDRFKINKAGIDITIIKNIPIGAGLGGGSSNAASVLKILAKHFKIKNSAALKKIALSLGSDVPFFLLSQAAYASSRGEKLKALTKFKVKSKILIVNPGIHISTPWAYKAIGIRNSKTKILNSVKVFDTGNKRLMLNDFERVVFKKYPKIERLKYDMYRLGAAYALMSGSGSTVYGLFIPKKIKAAKKYFSGLGYKVFAV